MTPKARTEGPGRTCFHCGKLCASPQGKAAHERTCVKNPKPVKSAKPGSRLDALIDAMRGHGGTLTLKEMDVYVPEIARQNRSVAMARLVETGVVERIGPSTYKLTGKTRTSKLDQRRATRDAAILEAFRKAGGAAHIVDVAKQFEAPSAVRKRISEMAREGLLIERRPRGVYELSDDAARTAVAQAGHRLPTPADITQYQVVSNGSAVVTQTRPLPTVRGFRRSEQREHRIVEALTVVFPNGMPITHENLQLIETIREAVQ